MAITPLFVGVIGLFAIERAAEIVINRRNSRALALRGAVWLPDDGFPLLVLAQGALFVGTIAEVALGSWTGVGGWTWPAIVGLALAQLLRYWCISTLGERWSIRVVTLPGAARIRGGPYRFLDHPNYAVVVSEAILLPLAFGAWLTLLVAAPLQLAAVLRRVRLEEHALQRASA